MAARPPEAVGKTGAWPQRGATERSSESLVDRFCPQCVTLKVRGGTRFKREVPAFMLDARSREAAPEESTPQPKGRRVASRRSGLRGFSSARRLISTVRLPLTEGKNEYRRASYQPIS